MTSKLTLGKKIKAMRALHGMSQGELARIIGMPQVTLSYIENDHVGPTPEKMEVIKAALSWPDEAEAAFAILAGDGDEPLAK